MKVLLGVIAVLALSGCGSSGGTRYVTEGPATPAVPAPDGTSLIVSGNSGNTGITYTNVGEGGILVDCGEGGCGDVYVASPIEGDIGSSGEANASGGCSTGSPCSKG